jgi:hypothetical protein
MKRFFKEMVIGVASLFFINLIVFYSIINPEVYRPYESTMQNINAENFIFSDSHGWSLTINYSEGERLLKAYNIQNLSYGSDSYFDIYFKLKYLIKQNIKIDTIYLSADPHMLGQKRVNNNNRNLSIVYADFETYKLFFDITYPEFFVRKYLRKYLSTFDVNNAKLIQEYLGSMLSYTSTKNSQKWIDLSIDQRVKQSAARFENFYQKGSTKKLEKALNKVLLIAKQNKINVVGVEFPVSEQMKSLGIPENIVELKNILNDNGIEVLSLNHIEDPKYFNNQDHVNELGAKIIIDKIIKH